MANPLPPIPIDELILVVHAFKEAGWNRTKAAALAGMPYSTFKYKLAAARKRGIKPKGGWPDMPITRFPAAKDKPSGAAPVHSDSAERVFVIGDAHDCPSLPDKERFYRLGCAARNWGADRIVWIGDVMDMKSLCGHIGDETLRGRVKPSFLRDIESGHAALDEFMRGLRGDKEQDATEGNHEGGRVDAVENNNPNADGLYRKELDRVWQLHGIRNHRYGVPLNVGGVDFVHVPMRFGKPIGGKLAARTVAISAVRDCFIGHCHRFCVHSEPKNFNELIRVVETGTTLPHGYIADYHKHQQGGWAWGATRATIRDGKIDGVDFVSMADIMREQ